MLEDIQKVLIDEKELSQIVKGLGKRVSEDYKDKNLLMVSILKGAIVFMSDLMRYVTIPCEIDFMSVSSYRGGIESTGVVKILKDLDVPLGNYDVLIVEDILDSGRTLSYILKMLKTRNPKSLKICTLFDKPFARKCDIKADYIGTQIPNEFVVGYGMDYQEKYRNLPFLAVLKPQLYS